MNSNIGYRDEDNSKVKGDSSGGEYYCDVCDATMNSVRMWESHMEGKRHLKNVKKIAEEPLPQVKSVKKDVPSFIQSELDRLEQPVIGLNDICEINSTKTACEPTYTCNLCHVGGDKKDIIDHILTTKHRSNYIKKVDPDGFKLIESMCLVKCAKDPLIAEKAAEIEQKEGRGKIEVREEVLNHRKRNYNDPEYKEYERSKRERYEDSVLGCADYRPPQIPADYEFIRRVRFFPLDAKLRMLEELSEPKITTDTEARVVSHTVKILDQLLMQYKMRCAAEQFHRKPREIMAENMYCSQWNDHRGYSRYREPEYPQRGVFDSGNPGVEEYNRGGFGNQHGMNRMDMSRSNEYWFR